MLKVFLQRYQQRQLLLILGDILIIIVTLSLILLLDAYGEKSSPKDLRKYVGIIATFCAITIIVLYILNLFDISKPNGYGFKFLLICIGMLIVTVIYSALSYLLISLRPGKINLLLFALTTGILAYLCHNTFHKLVKTNVQRILFIGNEKIFDDISQFITDNYSQYYTIVGHWHRHSHNPTLPNLLNFIENNNADLVVYSVHSKVLKQVINDLITIKFSKRNIINAYNFYQLLTLKYPVYYLDDFWLLVNAQKEIFFPTAAGRLKRSIDLFVVLLFLPLAVVLFLIAALAIKLESKGPVFFIQERLGQDEVPFRLYKLRTMIDNAESLNGPQWAVEGDCRITRVGKVLRKLRLDELPQLVNILKGEMSLVGPRPIRQHFTEILAKEIPFYKLRLLVKPGLTGWAQVNSGHAHTNEGHSQVLQYDLFYLINQSLWLDLFILCKTFKVMVWGKGT